MSEWSPPRTRRERERVRGVQLILEGMAARVVAVYEHEPDTLPPTDLPTYLYAVEESPPPEAA